MLFTILTLFPEMFPGVLNSSILGRAREKGLARYRVVDIREFGVGRHRVVDDAPFGGGPGMVMRPDVLNAALAETRKVDGEEIPGRVIYLSPQGTPFSHAVAQRLAAEPHLVLLCGRYEGVDERFCQTMVDEEISLGDFVLTGGEIPAMAVIDAVTRLLPGVLGDQESAVADSFVHGVLDHPHHTRPASWRDDQGREHAAPAVLLSGNHGEVAAWRRRQALLRTLIRRPDLLAGAPLDKAERRLLTALQRELEQDGTDD